MDMIWFVVGITIGAVYGMNKTRNNIPEDLEKCDVDRKKLTDDIAYYKKLTKTLVDENTELRKKLNKYEQ
jgi:hypothetical protein